MLTLNAYPFFVVISIMIKKIIIIMIVTHVVYRHNSNKSNKFRPNENGRIAKFKFLGSRNLDIII